MNRRISVIFGCLVVFLFVDQQLLAQIIDPQSYFPCSIGNQWQWHAMTSGTNTFVEITRDSIGIDRNKYIFMNRENIPRYKLDTMHNVYQFLNLTDPQGHITLGSEILLYKLDAAIGDSFYTMNGKFVVKLSGYTTSIFGQSTIVRTYTWYPASSANGMSRYSIALGFGLVSSEGPIDDEHLTGCVIDGVAFGDPLSVSHKSIISPDKCILVQNYPNPFNPTTSIKYDLPKSSWISIKVFNLLGAEIGTLFSGYCQEGSHTINWDASNCPSGVYFCRIFMDNISQCRKMLLLQ